jgi:formylglycine-generating enzyme required for sulfatase activity
LERWDGVPPWAVDALPLRLPPAGVLAEDDVFVSSGWFLSGGDPDSPSSLPSRRLWADGFVIKRDPVTNREYLDYLNELVLDGLVDEAERAVPRERGSPGEPIYGREARRPLSPQARQRRRHLASGVAGLYGHLDPSATLRRLARPA